MKNVLVVPKAKATSYLIYLKLYNVKVQDLNKMQKKHSDIAYLNRLQIFPVRNPVMVTLI